MSEKLVIDKSTLIGIGNAIRTKKGSTDLIPVPNLESEVLSIPTGGGGTDILPYEYIGEWTAPEGGVTITDAQIVIPCTKNYNFVFGFNIDSSFEVRKTIFISPKAYDVVWGTSAGNNVGGRSHNPTYSFDGTKMTVIFTATGTVPQTDKLIGTYKFYGCM